MEVKVSETKFGFDLYYLYLYYSVADLRRSPEGAMPPPWRRKKQLIIIDDYFLFNPTVEGVWIDQKAQKLLSPLKTRPNVY